MITQLANPKTKRAVDVPEDNPLRAQLYFRKHANEAHRRVAHADPADLHIAYLDLQAAADDTQDPQPEPSLRQLYADLAALCYSHAKANEEVPAIPRGITGITDTTDTSGTSGTSGTTPPPERSVID